MRQTNQCRCRKGLIAPVLYQPLARESKEAKHLSGSKCRFVLVVRLADYYLSIYNKIL